MTWAIVPAWSSVGSAPIRPASFLADAIGAPSGSSSFSRCLEASLWRS
jgi:hypothetical protein